MKERECLAILAIAKPYRAIFDYIETDGLIEGYVPATPSQG